MYYQMQKLFYAGLVGSLYVSCFRKINKNPHSKKEVRIFDVDIINILLVYLFLY